MTAPWLIALIALGVQAALAQPCGTPDRPCSAGDGVYLARPPDGWSGGAGSGGAGSGGVRSDGARLPLLLFLHGYRGSAAAILSDAAIGPVASHAGMLLVAPEGRDATWSHAGSPSRARNDVAFLRAVIADARRRWPVDPNLIVAAGFSQGGSMIWELACHDAEGITAFLPFSGAFWEPLPRECPAGPVVIRHVHGLADPVVPMQGRVIRQVFRQGDVLAGLALRRAVNQCPEAPDQRTISPSGLTCETWSTCASGQVQLCLHVGAHEIEAAWLAEGLAWVRSVTRPR